MGVTFVPLTINNLQQEHPQAEGDFLVDSGAGYTILPEKIWKLLNIQPDDARSFTLADGKKVRRRMGNAFVTYNKHRIATPVILGKKNDTAVLGVFTLEALGLVLDPFERKLYQGHFMM